MTAQHSQIETGINDLKTLSDLMFHAFHDLLDDYPEMPQEHEHKLDYLTRDFQAKSAALKAAFEAKA